MDIVTRPAERRAPSPFSQALAGPQGRASRSEWLYLAVCARMDATEPHERAKTLARYANDSIEAVGRNPSLRTVCDDLDRYLRHRGAQGKKGSAQNRAHGRVRMYLHAFVFGGYEAMAVQYCRAYETSFAFIWQSAKVLAGGLERIARLNPSLRPFLAYLELAQTAGAGHRSLIAASKAAPTLQDLSSESYRLQLRPLMSAISYRGLEGGSAMAALLLAGARGSPRLITAAPPLASPPPTALPARPAQAPASFDATAQGKALAISLWVAATSAAASQSPGPQPPSADATARRRIAWSSAVPLVSGRGSKRPRPADQGHHDGHAASASDVPRVPAASVARIAATQQARAPWRDASPALTGTAEVNAVPTRTFAFERNGLAMALSPADAQRLFVAGDSMLKDRQAELVARCHGENIVLSVAAARSLLALHRPDQLPQDAAIGQGALQAIGVPVALQVGRLQLFGRDWAAVLAEEGASLPASAALELLFNGHYLRSDLFSVRSLTR